MPFNLEWPTLTLAELSRLARGFAPTTADSRVPAELVPHYLPSIPRAKYCIVWGQFVYFFNEGKPLLFWYVVPPFNRRTYNFQTRQWRYIE